MACLLCRGSERELRIRRNEGKMSGEGRKEYEKAGEYGRSWEQSSMRHTVTLTARGVPKSELCEKTDSWYTINRGGAFVSIFDVVFDYASDFLYYYP